MKTTRQPLMLAATLAIALTLSACVKGNEPATPVPTKPPPSATSMALPMRDDTAATVSSVEIGSSVDANNEVRASDTTFAPKGNIYASVETIGGVRATLAAKWIYNGDQTVHEDSKMLDPMGTQTTAFMISTLDGFPAGNHKVEISLDGKPVASKDFMVKK